jgi:hypothetical protein
VGEDEEEDEEEDEDEGQQHRIPGLENVRGHHWASVHNDRTIQCTY